MTPAPKKSAPGQPAPAGRTDDQPGLHDEDPIAHRCMQYLLGELTAGEAARLEGELSASPEVNRELLVHADLLCAMSASAASRSQLPSIEPLPSSDAQLSAGVTSRAGHWWMIVAATAACLAVAVAGFLWHREHDLDSTRREASHTTPSGDEALMIARVWATDHVRQATVEEWDVADVEVDLVDDPLVDDDSFLAWMVVAVAADAERQSTTTGATTDG